MLICRISQSTGNLTFNVKSGNHNLSKISARMSSKTLFVCFLYFLSILLVSYVRLYIGNGIRNMNRENESIASVNEDEKYASQIKTKLKERFHLNLFDFNNFRHLKNTDYELPGRCVPTRIEVSNKLDVSNTQFK